MNVTLYAYNLIEKRIRGKGNLDVEFFEKDFVECVSVLCKRKPVDKKYKFDDINKVIYIERYEYDINNHILFLIFKSAEYGLIRKVVNTDTLAEDPKKKKGKKDGDEETTCAIIKFDSDEKSKKASCLLQVNSRGVSLSRIFEYLNLHIAAIHGAHKDDIRYCVKYSNVVSSDFIKSLENTDKIKTVKLVIDSEISEASEFKTFAEEEDVADVFEIVYKPATKGKGIGKDTVKKFFEKYKEEGADIKKIWVDSSESDGNPLSFDTEKMKEKEHIVVTDTLSKEPEIDELKREMTLKINKY